MGSGGAGSGAAPPAGKPAHFWVIPLDPKKEKALRPLITSTIISESAIGFHRKMVKTGSYWNLGRWKCIINRVCWRVGLRNNVQHHQWMLFFLKRCAIGFCPIKGSQAHNVIKFYFILLFNSFIFQVLVLTTKMEKTRPLISTQGYTVLWQKCYTRYLTSRRLLCLR